MFRLFCLLLVDLTNGQLTPNNNTPLLTQALSGTTRPLANTIQVLHLSSRLRLCKGEPS
jgi:hypothetical protein